MQRKRKSEKQKYSKKSLNRARFNNANMYMAKLRYSGSRRFGAEKKTLDIQFSQTYNSVWSPDILAPNGLNINTTPTFQALNLVQQGPGVTQRIGNKITLSSMRLRFYINSTGVALSDVSIARVMLIYDRQPSNAVGYPAINDVLNVYNQSNALTNPTGAALLNVGINPNNFERFKVLLDMRFAQPQFRPAAATAIPDTPTCMPNDVPFVIDKYIKLNNLETNFNNSAAPMKIDYVTTGSLFLLTIGDNAAGGEPWYYPGTARLRFHDN